MGQLQLLMFGALAFTLLILSGYYPAELRAINLDTDWFYRKGTKWVVAIFTGISMKIAQLGDFLFIKFLPEKLGVISRKPLTSLIGIYHKIVGKGTTPLEGYNEDAKPETVNLMPAGISVLLSIFFLLLLAVIFFAGQFK